jgi:hypothetical protein
LGPQNQAGATTQTAGRAYTVQLAAPAADQDDIPFGLPPIEDENEWAARWSLGMWDDEHLGRS